MREDDDGTEVCNLCDDGFAVRFAMLLLNTLRTGTGTGTGTAPGTGPGPGTGIKI